MNIQSHYQPGQHSLILDGCVGTLEAVLQSPKDPSPTHLAILGHPHPLYGGTMNNKVVTTLAMAFQEAGIPSLRFNFRGVKQSQGVYDAGIGESQDVLFLMDSFKKENPELKFYLAGFSFGSYVTYRAAAKSNKDKKNCVCQLISIAPAVQHCDFTEFPPITIPWTVIQGENDDVASPEAVYSWIDTLDPKPQLIKVPDTEHFFHGRLGILKDHLLSIFI